MRLSGQRPSQEAKWSLAGNADSSAPTSANKVNTLGVFSPGTAVRSVPRMR